MSERKAIRVEVRRDGQVKEEFVEGDETEMHNTAWRRLMRLQGMSTDWAMRYEGWDIVTVYNDGSEASTAKERRARDWS